MRKPSIGTAKNLGQRAYHRQAQWTRRRDGNVGLNLLPTVMQGRDMKRAREAGKAIINGYARKGVVHE